MSFSLHIVGHSLGGTRQPPCSDLGRVSSGLRSQGPRLTQRDRARRPGGRRGRPHRSPGCDGDGAEEREEVVMLDPGSLRTMFNDYETLLLAAVQQNGHSSQHASQELRADHESVLSAVQQGR